MSYCHALLWEIYIFITTLNVLCSPFVHCRHPFFSDALMVEVAATYSDIGGTYKPILWPLMHFQRS